VEGRNNALNTVIGWIIDDGNYSRGHRKSLFSSDFTVVGIASRVLGDKVITVLDLHSHDLPIKIPSSKSSSFGTKLPEKK